MHLPNHRITGRPAAALAIVLWSATFTAAAADSGDIEALRAEIADLRARVEHLEKEVRTGVAINPARAVKPLPGGWNNEKNWKLLARDMQHERVQEILGEPDRTRNVSKFEYWYYGQGKVTFYQGRLKSWDRP
jgi:hypothetical protein